MRAKSEERAPTILQLLAKLFLSIDVEPEQFIDMERTTNKDYDKKFSFWKKDKRNWQCKPVQPKLL